MGRKRRKVKTKKLSPAKLKSQITKHFIKNPKKRLNSGQLAKRLKITNNTVAIDHALEGLLKEDIIRSVSDSKYVLNKKAAHSLNMASAAKSTYTGSVEKIRSGAAYIIVESLDRDVYVPFRHLNGAFNGDLVEITVSFIRGRNPEGQVKKVLKRNTTQIMGRFQQRNKMGVVQSSSSKNSITVHIKKDAFNSANDGDRVLVEIEEWGNGPNPIVWGRVKKIFESIDDHNWTMETILVENGFSSDYPDEVLKECEPLSADYSEEELEGRRDFREILTFTIDPDTAQDFDDAISYQVLENGNTEVGVHIADVTHYVKPNTALDKEAYARSTSVYLVDRCIAMLPEKLSNELCSLKPNVDRLAFSAVFTFNKKNKLTGEWFGKSVIHSDHRFTYEEAQESIDTTGALFHSELEKINKIAHVLREEKFENGAIAFESDEVKFVLGEDNQPTGVFVKSRKDAHMLIEDFMLLANKRVAHYISKKKAGKPIPFVYRIHDLPDMDRLADLTLFMREMGIEMNLSTPDKIAESFNLLSAKAKEDDAAKILMQFAIRTMSKAVYSTDNIGHYGLHFEEYTHFTSPIRRYSDVLVHRILEKNLKADFSTDKAQLEAKCIHISKQERKAMEAERDSIKFKQVEYIQNHVGEIFNGVVSGMFERGIFVELSETKAEGLVPFNRFYDNYTLAPGRFKATTSNGKKSIKMGDKLMVRVISADVLTRQIELEPVEL
ncbi:MAG: ribonuclease R [Saprospiraceae bacterium]|nr:ribonuclease R [Saprospiraceae bacterium]